MFCGTQCRKGLSHHLTTKLLELEGNKSWRKHFVSYQQQCSIDYSTCSPEGSSERIIFGSGNTVWLASHSFFVQCRHLTLSLRRFTTGRPFSWEATMMWKRSRVCTQPRQLKLCFYSCCTSKLFFNIVQECSSILIFFFRFRYWLARDVSSFRRS